MEVHIWSHLVLGGRREMGPCLGTVGWSGGNSKSVVLISCDDVG